MSWTLETPLASVGLSIFAGWMANRLVRQFIPVFIERRLYGVDQCKKSGEKVAEPMGVIIASVYLIFMCVFLPLPFRHAFTANDPTQFDCHHFIEFLSGLLSICCMIFLGFADDVLDLRWRHKMLLPSLSALPLLLVYWAADNSTTVMLPSFVQEYMGQHTLDIGLLYYVYMGLLSIFCTHAINIYAGVNGLEAGQSLVIAVSVAIFNAVQLYRLETEVWYHMISLYFLLPYIAVTFVLLRWNWYPASVFVGDTFCYFSGMTFAVVGILGHFSKTMLLFFAPQVANFLYSCPQLFRIVPCPRHRLPRYDPATNLMNMSLSTYPHKSVGSLGHFITEVLHRFGVLHKRRFTQDGVDYVETSNMTLLNLALKLFGPMHEESLTKLLLIGQAASSILVFFVRFHLASYVYEVVR